MEIVPVRCHPHRFKADKAQHAPDRLRRHVPPTHLVIKLWMWAELQIGVSADVRSQPVCHYDHSISDGSNLLNGAEWIAEVQKNCAKNGDVESTETIW